MSYYEYFAQQASQTGSGQYFAGPIYQRGSGLGSTFRSIFNFIKPLFKPAARFLGKQLLRTGAHIATDLAEGRNFKESVKDHGTEAGSNIVNAAIKKMQGRGLKRKAPQKKVQSKRSRPQRRKSDKFDE